jgi:hypothetical protein
MVEIVGARVNVSFFLPRFLYRAGEKMVVWYRKVRYGYGYRRVKLTKGKYAKVDAADYERVTSFRWSAVKKGRKYYAVSYKSRGGRKFNLGMHRFIMGVRESRVVVDHINHDGLDNRRANLRLASHRENMRNMRKWKGGKSRCSSSYKGVARHRERRKWRSQITVDGVQKFLGYHEDEESAARAYDEAAKQYFGEFACLNFGDE